MDMCCVSGAVSASQYQRVFIVPSRSCRTRLDYLKDACLQLEYWLKDKDMSLLDAYQAWTL